MEFRSWFVRSLVSALVGGNSQTGNSRGRESIGIPREFPFLKWRFLGIPGNSLEFPYRGDILALQGGIFIYRVVLFYLQGGASSLRRYEILT